MFSNDFVPKNPQKYECLKCDYNTCNKKDYTKHIQTQKHKKRDLAMFSNEFVPKNPQTEKFECEICKKKYLDNSGLWKHKKKCNVNNNNTNVISPELIMNVLQQNNNLQQLLMEQNKTIIELSKNNQIITTNNNNTNTINSHNKSFNLQFFLNETCKDAMNLSDFINSLTIQLSDLENVGKLGFVDGISNIIIKNLEALDVEKRPIHCCDAKRETMYIKDQDKWEKEDNELKRMKELVRTVRDKNISMVNTWRDLYPECVKSDSKKTTQYNNIYMEAFGGETGGEKGTKKEKEEKIISRIAKSVIIDKHE
jgi:hypothetical protein